MQIAKHIISLVIVLTVLCSGFHVFPPEDINRNGGVGLEDAILSVKAFLGIDDAPEEFTAKIKNTLSAFQINAGLKTVIKNAKDNGSKLYPNLIFLILIIYLFTFVYIVFYMSYNSFIYKSISILPNLPPPRIIS